MTSIGCPRLSEAEALRDGRLGASERSSFERHVSGCAACGRELEALEALAEPLREASCDTDELHARRERARLLSAFGGSLAAPAQQKARRPLQLWAAAVAALACGSLALGLWLGRPGAPVQGAPAPSAVVHADSAAVWSTRTVGAREEILLSHGALLIHVDHRRAEQPRLRVVLPDGELEDIGTIFSVSVHDQRTARVAVHEGSVVLRLRDRPEVTIAAGNTWTPEAAPAPAIAPPTLPPPPSAKPIERPRRTARPPSSAPAPQAAADSDPARDFRAATAAFRRGESREAATAFTRFLAQHAGDPRAEDAAYLRVLALQRCGTREDVRSAARQYLEHYPDGLRRAEVTRLAVLPDEPAGR